MHDLDVPPERCADCRPSPGLRSQRYASEMQYRRREHLELANRQRAEERDPAVVEAAHARLTAIRQPTSDPAWLAWDAAHRRLDDAQRAAYDRLVVRDLEAARRR